MPPEERITPAAPVTPDGRPARGGKRHLIRPTWLRRMLKTLGVLLLVILSLPFLVYVPFVQDWLKDIACGIVSDATGMKVDIGRFRLHYPLDVELERVKVIGAEGDTLVSARSLLADVRMLPLLKLDVQLNKVRLEQGVYNMVSADSSLTMGLRAGTLQIAGGSNVNLKKSHIDLRGAILENARVNLRMNVWKQKKDTASTPTEWIIKADSLQLKNVTFAMSMLPTIDTLGVHIGAGKVKDALIDLKNSNIKIGFFGCNQGQATYLTPTAQYIAAHPAPVDTVSPPSAPMTVSIDSCHLNFSKALYGVAGARPQPGFDPSYISVTDADLSVAGFFNQASVLRLPLRSLKASERCGLQIKSGSGTVAIDSSGITLKQLDISTAASRLKADAYLSYAMMAMNPDAPLTAAVSGYLGWSDIYAFMPSLRPLLRALPQGSPIDIDLDATGSLASLAVKALRLNVSRFLRLTAHGSIDNPTDMKRLRGNLALDGRLSDARAVNLLLASAFRGLGISIPTFSISGNVAISPGNYDARLKLLTSAGDLKADATLNLNAESYDADITARSLNVASIMPSLGVGTVSGHILARGAGFNPSRPSARTKIDADMATLVYGGHDMAPLELTASLERGQYDVALNGHNPDLNLDLTASGSINGNNYVADVDADIRHADLRALGLMADTCAGSGRLSLNGSANPSAMLFDLDLSIDDIIWQYGAERINLPHALDGSILATADSVSADIHGDGLDAYFDSGVSLRSIMAYSDRLMPVIERQLKARLLDMEELQAALPPFCLKLNADSYGLMGDALSRLGYRCDRLDVGLSNRDSIVAGDIKALAAGTESMLLDTVTLNFTQRGKMIDYSLHAGNTAGNLPEFASVDLNGYIGGNRGSVFLRQRNDKGETGYRLGLTAAMLDSAVSVHLTPLSATIGYKRWTISDDNYIEIGPGRKVQADLLAESDGSKVSLKTSTTDDGHSSLAIGIDDVHIEDFLQMSLNAPPVTGNLNADLNIVYRGTAFAGNGTIGVKDLCYDKKRVGDLLADFKAGYALKGNTGGKMDLYLDKAKVLTARGYLLTDSATIKSRQGKQTNELNLELTRFPLSVANAFVGNDMMQLTGYLNGSLNVGGFMTSPLLNGSITCDSVSVFVPMAASRISFDPESEIAVKDNVLGFNDFPLHCANSNPLMLNGVVDARSLSDILFDISLNGKNVALVDNTSRSHSDIYGKLYADIEATAKGSTERMDINASLSVLPSTDITYALTTASSELQQTGTTTDVVKFVQFADSTVVAAADSLKSRTMGMRVNASLNIISGAEVTVLLSTNGTDKVQLNPYGSLTYTQNYMGDMRLNGNLFLGTGFARYSVMLVGQKTFSFEPGSYIGWNGDVMNPALHINATDHVKANVQQEGANSRLIYFDVGLAVTGTLSAPKVVFDLSTQDDMTVQNELLSMTPEQRSASAMNLLLYNTYTGPGVKATANLSNPLYSFITGQLNSWAAKNIRGVDLTFGVDNYKQTVDGQSQGTTSYSYQVSKSLFDNRFKIVVGGNYSTNADADENFEQNLISDISFEYSIKQTDRLSMYVKLFRHTGFESVLEGEVTETGVGFVMKRKINSLRGLFRWPGRRRRHPVDSVVPVTADSIITVDTITADTVTRK